MLRSAGIIVPGDLPPMGLPALDGGRGPRQRQPTLANDSTYPTTTRRASSDATPILAANDDDCMETGPHAALSSPSQTSSSSVLASMPIPPNQRPFQTRTNIPPPPSVASAAVPDTSALLSHLRSSDVTTPLVLDTIETSPTGHSGLLSSLSTHSTDTPPSILATADLEEAPRISIAFRDLVYTVPVRHVENGHSNGNAGHDTALGLPVDPEAPASTRKATAKCWNIRKRWARKAPGEKVVLHGISGEFLPGQLVGILGPSGSGKTSLLNILAGLPSTGVVSGNVMLNSQPLSPAEIRSVVGFVFQDDLILATMTVTEALTMSLRLRNPPMSQEEEHKRIELAIDLLGLHDARDTLIGSSMQKGISGGERKRVAIGMELMAKPAVVLLDECTTGLDSYTAFSVCSLLRKLAHRQGKTIVCTLHQPASDIVQVLDVIMILVKGKLLYHGPTTDMVSYFSRLNFQCPQYNNPTDYVFMSVINQRGGCEHLLCLHFLPPPSTDESCKSIQLDALAKYYPSFLQQIRYLSWRAWHNAVRNRLMLCAHLGQVVILGVLIGLIYLNIEDSGSGPALSQSISGVMFFVATNLLFGGAMPVLSIFATERPVFLREYLQGYYGVLAYYLSRTIVEFPFQVLFPLVFACISYWLVLFSASVAEFLVYCMFLTLLGLVGSAFGIGMASMFEDLGVSLAVVPVLLLPLMLFGGLLVNNDTSPKWLSWLEWVSPVQYAFTGLMENYWRDRIVKGVVGNDHLDQIGVSDRFGIFLNAVFLIILWAAFTILGYIGLRRIANKAAGRQRHRPSISIHLGRRKMVNASLTRSLQRCKSFEAEHHYQLDHLSQDHVHFSPQEVGLVHQGVERANGSSNASRPGLTDAAVPLGYGVGT